MVEDSHFHQNFELLNTLTQGMFEGLKDYEEIYIPADEEESNGFDLYGSI